jgi:hypothetical protein
MRTTARRSRRSTCTDTTEPCHRWPSLHCMHGWLGPRTGPRPPQRAPDVNYGASPHTARDPPDWRCGLALTVRTLVRPNWAFCVPVRRHFFDVVYACRMGRPASSKRGAACLRDRYPAAGRAAPGTRRGRAEMSPRMGRGALRCSEPAPLACRPDSPCPVARPGLSDRSGQVVTNGSLG